MTNRELLATPKELLGPLDRQRQHVLRAEQSPMPCPARLQGVGALAAAGADIDEYRFDVKPPGYRWPTPGSTSRSPASWPRGTPSDGACPVGWTFPSRMSGW